MEVGQRINTNLGEVLVLDIQKKYLILFNEENKQFIKANGYQEEKNKIFWNGGEYYNTFNDLIENISL